VGRKSGDVDFVFNKINDLRIRKKSGFFLWKNEGKASV
jgi:hypothetical protein